MTTPDTAHLDPSRIWQHALLLIKQHLGEHVLRAHASRLKPVGFKNNALLLTAPSPFLAKYAESALAQPLERILPTIAPPLTHARFLPHPPHAPALAASDNAHGSFNNPPQPHRTPLNENPLLQLARSPSNDLAVAAASSFLRNAQNPDPNNNHILYLHGSPGTGKSALLLALAQCLPSIGIRPLLIPGEIFVSDFSRAMREKNAAPFKQRLRSADALLIDDVHFIANSGDATRNELLHTLNSLAAQHKPVALAADAHPSKLLSLNDATRSRLNGGVAVQLLPPDRTLLQNVLKQRLGNLADPLRLETLAQEAPPNLHETVGLVARFTLLQQQNPSQPPSLNALRQALNQNTPHKSTPPSVNAVQLAVAREFHLTHAELLSNTRARYISTPRQIAMYLSKTLTQNSYPHIAARFKKRDHTTVIHACKRARLLIDSDPFHQALVQRVIDSLQNPPKP